MTSHINVGSGADIEIKELAIKIKEIVKFNGFESLTPNTGTVNHKEIPVVFLNTLGIGAVGGDIYSYFDDLIITSNAKSCFFCIPVSLSTFNGV